MSDLRIEFPIKYEDADGGVISRAWAGKVVPVPPFWVKQRVKLPAGCENATLARSLPKLIAEDAREKLVEYVRDYANTRRFGTNLVIGGVSSTFRRRQFLAAAVLNEIVMRYSHRFDLSVGWMSPRAATAAMDSKKDRSDQFFAMRNRFNTTRLLLIEEPLRINPLEGTDRFFVENVMEHRANEKLPSIVTLGADLRQSDAVKLVKHTLGGYVAEVLTDEHQTLTVYV